MPALLRYASLALTLLAAPAFSGCTMGDGTTPSCTDEDSCQGYATCVDDAGKPADARTVCCAGLNAQDLAACLEGYGVETPKDAAADGGS